MRSVKVVLAGILLFAAVFAQTALLSRPSFAAVGVTAAAVFVPLWYVVMLWNGRRGVELGYRIGAEVKVFILVFGLPAVVAGLGAWVSVASWAGGPVVGGGRTPIVLATGLLLWAAIAALAALFDVSYGAAALVFLPLWVLLCAVNGAIGVVAAGYGVLEEVVVFLLNVIVPGAVAISAWLFRRRRPATVG